MNDAEAVLKKAGEKEMKHRAAFEEEKERCKALEVVALCKKESSEAEAVTEPEDNENMPISEQCNDSPTPITMIDRAADDSNDPVSNNGITNLFEAMQDHPKG